MNVEGLSRRRRRRRHLPRSAGGRKESICFLFISKSSPKAAALYELEITIVKDKDGGDVIISPEKHHLLKQLSTFFDQGPNKYTHYAACAPLGSSGKYLLMPNEYQNRYVGKVLVENFPYSREYPLVFDSVTNKTTMLSKAPLGPKMNPIVAKVDDKLYVLSSRFATECMLPEPSFEVFDPEDNSWNVLPEPPYNKNVLSGGSPNRTLSWCSRDYAVYGEFIIVCFWNRWFQSEHDIYSYNTLSGAWKPVDYDTDILGVYDDGNLVDVKVDCRGDGDSADYLVWVGKALVINKFIYAYVSAFDTLVSYHCTKAISKEARCDFSLARTIVVDCRESLEWGYMAEGFRELSGAVGKISDCLICLVKTIASGSDNGFERQPVHVTIFRIFEEGKYTKLKSFDLLIPGKDMLFYFSAISSCFMLQKEHSRKKGALSYKDVVVQGWNRADVGDKYRLGTVADE